MLLLILCLCGFSGGLATRLFDPLITAIASDFDTSVSLAALLSSAFALLFGLSQPLLGPAGDSFGKAAVVKLAAAVLAISLLASAAATNITLLFASRILGGVAAGGIMPISMALIADNVPLVTRQVAMSRFVGASLLGQLLGVSLGGIVAEAIGWRGLLGCAAAFASLAAAVAVLSLPKSRMEPSPFRLAGIAARYRLVFNNPLSFVCFGIVFLEGIAIYGMLPFIGEMLQSRRAGGVREAGFVLGGLGTGGLVYALVASLIVRLASRRSAMVVGGGIGALGLAAVGLNFSWQFQAASMVVLGFGFFLLHSSLQVEVTELAPSARASSFSLHAMSFCLGQALGPVLYGAALPNVGATVSLLTGGAVLAAAGLLAAILLGKPMRTDGSG